MICEKTGNHYSFKKYSKILKYNLGARWKRVKDWEAYVNSPTNIKLRAVAFTEILKLFKD